MTRFAFVARASLLLVALPAPVLAGGVRIVEPTGTQNFADIQSAVNAAPDGAVLLVAGGTYAGFTVFNKSLSILAVGGVTIQGTMTVSSIASDQTFVAAGLNVRPPNETALIALQLEGSTGNVRFQDCTFHAADYANGVLCESAPARDGVPGVIVVGCTKVAFTHCTITGGEGEFMDEEAINCQYHGGGDSGAGLQTNDAAIVLYDCQVNGARGGGATTTTGGLGGAGAHLGSTQLFASACSFRGGNGGFISHQNCYGTGGPGVRLAGGSTLDEIGSSFQGGFEGCFPPGAFHASIEGGPVNSIPGPARTAVIGPTVRGDAAQWSVSFQGKALDRPFLFASYSPNTQSYLPFHGAWLTLRAAMLQPQTLPQANASGASSATLPTPDLPAGSLYERRFSQIVVRGQGQVYLGSGAALFLLDRQSGPDCNGNGTSDFLDVIEGTSPDMNQNLIPDSCPGG